MSKSWPIQGSRAIGVHSIYSSSWQGRHIDATVAPFSWMMMRRLLLTLSFRQGRNNNITLVWPSYSLWRTKYNLNRLSATEFSNHGHQAENARPCDGLRLPPRKAKFGWMHQLHSHRWTDAAADIVRYPRASMSGLNSSRRVLLLMSTRFHCAKRSSTTLILPAVMDTWSGKVPVPQFELTSILFLPE